MADASMAIMVSRLGIPNPPEIWSRYWNESLAAFDSAHPDFLDPGYLTDQAHRLKIADEPLGVMLSAAEMIRNSPDLTLLIRLWHYMLPHTDDFGEEIDVWPLPEKAMGDLAPMFRAIVAMSALDHMGEGYRKYGLSNDVMEMSLAYMHIWLEDYHARFGVWGVDDLSWILLHFGCKIFELGRLQFMPRRCRLGIYVYRNRTDGSLTVLAEPGLKYRTDGLRDGSHDFFDPNAWTTRLTVTDDAITGNPITPDGFAHPETVEISRDEWEEVLSPGSMVLDVHIPSSGKLTPESCDDSFRQSVEFFARYFPDLDWKAYTISTWLLDYQLRQMLPDDSNIIRFQRRFYSVPIMTGDADTMGIVFGSQSRDLSTLRRDTSLRRAILDYVALGHRMCNQGGFVLR
jgi:hypothetical protein